MPQTEPDCHRGGRWRGRSLMSQDDDDDVCCSCSYCCIAAYCSTLLSSSFFLLCYLFICLQRQIKTTKTVYRVAIYIFFYKNKIKKRRRAIVYFSFISLVRAGVDFSCSSTENARHRTPHSPHYIYTADSSEAEISAASMYPSIQGIGKLLLTDRPSLVTVPPS